jgi:hypothetical protein
MKHRPVVEDGSELAEDIELRAFADGSNNPIWPDTDTLTR